MIPPNILCKRDDCPIERMMRAMEAWRAEQAAADIAKPQSVNDYAHTCSICKRTPKWERYPDGTVRALTSA